MNSAPSRAETLTDAAVVLPDSIQLPDQRGLSGLFSAAISLALLVMVGEQFRHMSFAAITALVPHAPAFWLAFAASYLAIPACEWMIYNRLWRLPGAGVGALMRKMVSNELLLGYLGEAQFYAWARSRLAMTAAPFAAIKDVTILSALVGNVVTLVLLVPAWGLIRSSEFGPGIHPLFVSLGVVLASSFAILLLRERLFSLKPTDLRFITAIHLTRTFAQLILAALMWHWVLPGVPLHLWFVLATLKMLVSRLPLVPNKDVVFAGLAVMLLGHEAQVASLLTMMAGLILVTHLVVGACFGLGGLFDQWRERRTVRDL